MRHGLLKIIIFAGLLLGVSSPLSAEVKDSITVSIDENDWEGGLDVTIDIGSSSEMVTLGDVNNDGEVDLTDVVLIFDYFMGEELTDFVEEAADFNGDGDVDLTDVVLVFDYFMDQ